MEKKIFILLGLMLVAMPKPGALDLGAPYFKIGIASWYSESDPGINLTTANGEIFDDSKLTCASWDFPFETHLRVTDLASGKSIVCRVNDRGPAKRLERVIDLTKSAFQKIAPLHSGLIKVKVEMVSRSDY